MDANDILKGLCLYLNESEYLLGLEGKTWNKSLYWLFSLSLSVLLAF